MDGGRAEVAEAERPDRFDAATLAAANINPTTRLATDYLNHFNTIVMLLDLIPDMPECAEEIVAWRPAAYPAYFAAAHFRDRDLAIAAYHAADPAVRRDFDAAVAALDAAMAEAQALLARADLAHPMTAVALRLMVTDRLRPLISRAGGIINGDAPAVVAHDFADPSAAQDSVDELFP